MSSGNLRLDLYNPKTIESLEQGFDSSWVVLQGRDAIRDFERDSDLKTALSIKLAALAADGVNHSAEPGEWALEGLVLR